MNRRLVSTTLVGAAMLLSAGLLQPSLSLAQDATPAPGTTLSSDRNITVNGRGTVTIEPDSASISLGVDVSGETLVQTQQDSADRMTKVIETLTDAGVAKDQIQTVNYTINVINEYDDNGRLKGVAGYQVSNQVQVTTDDIEGLGKLIDELVQSGANTIYGITFLTSDATAAMSQARSLAVSDAKSKAQELAKASGVSLGDILTVTETSNVGGPVAKASASATDFSQSTTPIQSGSLQIVIDIVVSFAIA